MDTIYTVVFNTVVFFDDCKNWDYKVEGEKTWATFKAHFINKKLWYKRRQRATTKMGGFHGVNATQQDIRGQLKDEEEALINIARAAMEDRSNTQMITTVISK